MQGFYRPGQTEPEVIATNQTYLKHLGHRPLVPCRLE